MNITSADQLTRLAPSDRLNVLSEAPKGPSSPSCQFDDQPLWDLGTGSLSDIRRLSPGFYGSNDVDTQRRVRSLQRMAETRDFEGVHGVPTVLNGAEVYEFTALAPKAAERVRVRILTERTNQDGAQSILVVGNQCDHIVAKDSCGEHGLATRVTHDKTVSCISGHAVPDQLVLVSVDGDYKKHSVELGKPFTLPQRINYLSNARVRVEVPAAPYSPVQAETVVDQFSNATGREVAALVDAGFLESAALAWSKVPSGDRISSISEVSTTLVQRIESESSTVKGHDLRRLVAKLQSMGDFPGVTKGLAVLMPAAKTQLEVLSRQGGPNIDDISLGVILIKAYPQLNAEPFVERYRTFLDQGALRDERALHEYYANLATDDELKIYHFELQAQEQEQEEAYKVQQLWAQMQPNGDQIALMKFAQTWHIRQGNVDKAVSLQTRGELLQERNFCPQKREFLRSFGAAKYKELADAHCKNGGLTHDTVDGQVSVTKECFEAYRSPC